MPAQDLPLDCAISASYVNASFADSYWVKVDPLPDSALAAYILMVKQAPSWVNGLMSLRNQIVKHLGLKDLGALASLDEQKNVVEYRVGDRLGIFSIVSLTRNELVLSDVDKHLRVQLSVQRVDQAHQQGVSVTTVVHNHNLLGKVYMFFVAPVHKLIVPATLAKLGK
ncbi:DUF2867 domain-containing protein [Deefgea piscis]|uniref:DUF2867 domain-containing protein n=1 Tax=Deefgea piscis TaxID=2739061 RepID=UPI001C826226|nr:DUF2867 domain-containing protein [Deefgea piscis]QZA79733.1 DUF2867 domain-containing protein [Deefgea piscis]